MFEESFVYGLIKCCHLPLFVRHNRDIYQKDPDVVDPVRHFMKAMKYATVAYLFGKIIKQK